MKTQRRHELKINTLDQALANLPNKGRRQTVMTAVLAIVIVLMGVLYRFRQAANQDRLALANDNLGVVHENIDRIKQLRDPPSYIAELFGDTTSRLDLIASEIGDSDPKIAVQALVARGDLDWAMAAVAGATTQPSVNQQSPADLLSGAQAAWQQAVATYPQQHFYLAAAHMGLAALAENRAEWEEARAQYQAIVDDGQVGDVFQNFARSRMASLDQLKQAPLIATTPK